jgi:gliding motility-associated-like protein
MKLVTRCLLFLASGLLTMNLAHAQTIPCVNPAPLPPSCTEPFRAIDVSSGLPVTSFCVGQTVRFENCRGRGIGTGYLYYGVLPGFNNTSTFAADNCKPADIANGATFTYTATRADAARRFVTVSELAIRDPRAVPPPTSDNYDIRNFRVYDTVAPTFTVAPCPSSKARVTITDTTYNRYTIQAGSNPVVNVGLGQSKVQTVDVPGATSITVRGYYTATSACESQPSTQAIAPLPAPQTPLLTTLTLQDSLPSGAATLAVGQLPAGYIYTLQRTDAGGYAPVADVPTGRTSFPLNPVANTGYRLRRSDPCHVDSAFSPLLYPISLSGASTQNRNQLLFSYGVGTPDFYSVTRDGVALNGFTVIPGGLGLEDTTGVCGTKYSYQVTANYRPTPDYPSGRKSISNLFEIRTKSNRLPPQPRLLASFNLRNVVELTRLPATPDLPKGSTLYYRKAGGGGAPALFATVTTPRPARDSTALADLRAAPPCYSLSQVNACNISSLESPTTCPALLSASPADADGSSAALTWTPFTGPDPSQPANYVLQRLGPDFSVLPGSVSVSGSAYTDLAAPANRQVLRYRLQISGAGLPAGTFSYSNIATVTRQLFLTIPTAFTPNGDGLNDVLEVKGKYLDNYTFVVVDRNGQEVFRGTKRDDVWDGTIRGHAPVMGAYAWRFSQNNEDGSPFTATGAVTILK